MSKELYNTFDEALSSESVFSLLSSCNDITLVIYDSDNLAWVKELSEFFSENDLDLISIKELVFHGKNRIAVRRKTSDLSSYFVVPQMTYTGLSGNEMYCYPHLKRKLCIHILPDGIKREHISLIEKNRYMYQILISIQNDQIQINSNTSLRELYSKSKQPRKRVSKYCKDKRTYLQRLIDSDYLSAAYNQCAQECKNGCDECPHATSYGQDKNCPYFQLQMARFYENGWYVPKNDKIAHYWKIKAARQGMLEAKLDLANDYVCGNGCCQNIEEAISILMPLADQGYTSATHALIDITSSHHDYTSPLPLMARLANNGDLNMIERMIDIYTNGDLFTKPDPAKCEEWVVLAAEHGCIKHIESLAQQYEAINDWDNATRWYLRLQEINPDMDLSSKIDDLFLSKCELLTSDELLTRANKCYYGYECEQDYHSAYLYYKIASERDNPDGVYGLANCYMLGRGVEIDEVKGLELYELSAIKGSADGIIKKIETLRIQSKSAEIEEWKERLRLVFLEGEKNKVPHILSLIAQDYMGEGQDVLDVPEVDDEKGIEYYRAAVKLGDYESIRSLGRCYCEGMGVQTDYATAYNYIKEAADKGVATAYHCIGCMYRYGNKGLEKDEREGYRWFLKAAQKGYISAQVVVAEMLHKGIGVEINEEERVVWLEKAAIQGHKPSQCTLGEMYYLGKTVNKNYKKSRYWMEKAALGGYADAYFRYAYFCAAGQGGPIDYETALLYYNKLPKNSAALNNLGVLYASGKGVEADQEIANEYYKKAAEMGSARSMKNLAVRYLSGIGFEVDIDAAIEWLEKSFRAGLREAGIKLANLYFNGDNGIEQDINVAIELYESALEIKPDDSNESDIEEYVNLLLKLADIYYYGSQIEVNDLRANELYHIAAEFSSPKAYHMLGMQYYNGYGVDEDRDLAIYWFRKGAADGYEDSIEFLDENYIDWIGNNDPDLPF